MGNAGSYIRYSTEMQDDHSLDTQRAKIKDAAARSGDSIADDDWYSDAAETGRTPDRTNFMRMIRELKSGKKKHIKKIYVYKFSRFMRDNRESQYFKMQLEAIGVDVVSALEPLPEEKHMADFIEGMIELTDKLQSATIGIHVLDAMVELVKKKYWPGGPAPFGYRIERIDDREGCKAGNEPVKRSILVPDEREAPIVRRAFELSATTGWGGQRIYKKLCEEFGYKIFGRPRRRRNSDGNLVLLPASPLDAGGVNEILRKPIYKGIYVYNTGGYELAYNDDPKIDRRMRRKRVQKKENEHVRVSVDEWRLVSDEVWEKVQENRRENSRAGFGGGAKRAAFALSGMMVCGICGKSVAGHWQENRDGSNRYHYYRCRRSMSGRDCCANKARVRGIALESAIVAAVEEDLFSKQNIDFLVRMVEEIHQTAEVNKPDRAMLDRRRASLTAEIEALIELAGKAPIREIADKILERERLRARIDDEIVGAARRVPKIENLRAKIEERIGKTLGLLRSASDVAELRVELTQFIERVKLDPDGQIFVKWKAKPSLELLKVDPTLELEEGGILSVKIQSHFEAWHFLNLSSATQPTAAARADCSGFSGFSGFSGSAGAPGMSGFSGFSGMTGAA